MILLQILPILEDVPTYVDIVKGLGIAGLALILSYYFSKYVSSMSFEKVDVANKNSKEANLRAENSQKEFKDFLQKEYIANQLIIQNLTDTFKEHIDSKDAAINLIERLIQDKNVPSDYRKYFKK
jgi:type III secretory pathway component EscR